MAGSLTVLSAHRFGRAKEELQTAELLLRNANFRSSINRSYYAIFHAARAVLALEGLDFKKHSGVISNFQMRYIKTGIFDKQLSNIIKSAFSLRTESDYEDFYVIAKADVENQVREADIFYHAISEYIHEKIK